MTTGLGVFLGCVALATGLVAAAWVVVRHLVGKPLLPQAERPDPLAPPDLEHVSGIDVGVLNAAEMDEVYWIEETLAKAQAGTDSHEEALTKLDYYARESRRRRKALDEGADEPAEALAD